MAATGPYATAASSKGKAAPSLLSKEGKESSVATHCGARFRSAQFLRSPIAYLGNDLSSGLFRSSERASTRPGL